MAKLDSRKVREMSADDVLRMTGRAPAPDATPEVPLPQPSDEEVSAAVAAVEEGEKAEAAPAPPVVPAAQAGAPDPWALMAQMTQMLALLTAKLSSGDSVESKSVEKLTAALERMTTAQIEGARAAVEESRKAFRPENKVVPNVSVFNRRGTLLLDYQKPPLKCLMMLPWLAEWEGLTREEVELLNLLEAGSYVIKRADRSKITVEVVLEYKADRVTPSSLTIRHDSAYNNDNFKMMPPLADMLRDMLKQHDPAIRRAADVVLTDEEEEAMIEAGELSVSA